MRRGINQCNSGLRARDRRCRPQRRARTPTANKPQRHLAARRRKLLAPRPFNVLMMVATLVRQRLMQLPATLLSRWPSAAYRTEDRRRDAPRRFASRRYEASAAFAAIVAWAHQTSSSKAIFVAASRCASMSSMGLFVPIGEVDIKSAPGTV